MARIRQDDVDAVRERTDLVRLVQQYVALKKAGRSYAGLCPFHTEKTASFTVDPGKQVYYCFGCGAGGNAFHFLMGVESLAFPEAVERLARDAGVTLRYEGQSPGQRRAMNRRQTLVRANERAVDLYHRCLAEGREGADARGYLESRGISGEAAETFAIGYAPGYPDFLLRRMTKDFSVEILTEAGLAIRAPDGGVRDRFRARITFPVHDLSGSAVGFGARLLQGDGPKYLNSPETPVYRKGTVLYNLHRARGPITSAGEAFVVEGYTDVIALHQAGVETAVATCGTALTEDHVRLLARFGRRAILAFDSDEAGARAAERTYGFFESVPLEVSVVVLPEGLDPADLVRKEGGEGFVKAAARAVPLVEYMLRRTLRSRDLSGPEARAGAVRDALPIVSGLEDPVRRSQYGGLLADLVGVSPTDISLELARERPREEPGPTARRTSSGTGGKPRAEDEVRVPVREVEKEALKLIVQHPDVARGHADRIAEDLFSSERHRRAFALLRAGAASPADLVGRIEDRTLARLVAELTVEPLKGEASQEYAERIFAKLEEKSLKGRMDTISRRLQTVNPIKEPETFDPLFKELAEVTVRWRDARTRAGEGA